MELVQDLNVQNWMPRAGVYLSGVSSTQETLKAYSENTFRK